MPIKTGVVRKPKVNGIYQVSDKDLKINGNNPDTQHNVIVISIDEKGKKAKVKTITSLERIRNKLWFFKNHKLADVKNGDILVIPKTQLKSKKLSGVNHDAKTISLDKLHYKEPNDKTTYPKRYDDLIHKK